MFNFHNDLFHIGIRVADVEVTTAELTRTQGLTWASVQDRAMAVWLPNEGHVTMQLVLTYSVDGPVHLEVMSGPRGSIWDGRENPGVHHLGYWVDDVGAETERLIAQGGTLELAAAAPEDGYGRFTYVRSPGGVLVEPVASASRERFERWWAGGSLTESIPTTS